MKTEIIEAHWGRKRKQKGVKRDRRTSRGTSCSICGAAEPKVFGGGPPGRYCTDCARRTFSVGSARDPRTGSWETFWVIVDPGEQPQYTNEEWLKTRLRGADGELGWDRYREWNRIRDRQLDRQLEKETTDAETREA